MEGDGPTTTSGPGGGGATGGAGAADAGGGHGGAGGGGAGGATTGCLTALDCPEGDLPCQRVCQDGTCGIGATPEGTPCDHCGGDQCDGLGWCVRSDVCVTSECSWAKNFGDGGAQFGLGVAGGADGSLALVGMFNGRLDFGGGPIECSWCVGHDEYIGFVTELEGTGAHHWTTKLDSTAESSAEAVAVDGSGNVLVGGYFGGAMSVGDVPVESVDARDGFAAALTPGGEVKWVAPLGGPGAQAIRGVAAGQADTILVTGHFEGTVEAGASSLESSGQQDVLVASIDGSGAVAWARRFGSAGQDVGWRVAQGPEERIFVGGSFETTVAFDAEQLTSAGEQDLFVLELSVLGEVVHALRLGGPEDDTLAGLAVDTNGRIALTGRASSGFEVAGETACPDPGFGALLVLLDEHGDPEWWKCVQGSSGEGDGAAVAFDEQGNVVWASNCYGMASLDGHQFACTAGGVVVSRHDVFTGAALDVVVLDDARHQLVTGMTAGPASLVVATGGMLGDFEAADTMLQMCAYDETSNPYVWDVWVAKLALGG